ncbi:unnamed protein product, partial [Porites lobata]
GGPATLTRFVGQYKYRLNRLSSQAWIKLKKKFNRSSVLRSNIIKSIESQAQKFRVMSNAVGILVDSDSDVPQKTDVHVTTRRDNVPKNSSSITNRVFKKLRVKTRDDYDITPSEGRTQYK